MQVKKKILEKLIQEIFYKLASAYANFSLWRNLFFLFSFPTKSSRQNLLGESLIYWVHTYLIKKNKICIFLYELLARYTI